MATCWRLAVLAALAGCAAPAAPVAAEPEERRVTVWFTPALREPATLEVRHESGFEWEGPTARTGVTFPVPEGPCTLVLCVDGVDVAELSLRIERTVDEYDWRR
jgi:hypothetical protein